MKRTIVLCLAVTVFAGCKGDESTPSQSGADNNPQSSSPSEGYESPQAAFAALEKAAAAKDLPTFVRCMDAETQEMLATTMTLPLAFMAIDPEKEKDVNELLSKHGISLEDDSEAFPIKTTEGRIAFISDVLEWLEENSDGPAEESGPLNALVGSSLGEVTIEENTAYSTLTHADNQTDKIEFRRIGGKWFVHQPAPEFSSGPVTESNGSETFGNSDFGAFGGDDEPPPPIEAVPLAEYRSAWQVTLDVQNQPALEQLEKMAETLGMKLSFDPQLQATLQKPVTFQMTDKPRFAAIEEICRQIEVTPVYSASTLSFEKGKREQPVVFAGPFLIELASFETDLETATGRLSLHAVATGLPSTVMQLLTDGLGGPIQITGVADQNGNDLRRQGRSGAAGLIFEKSVFDREILIGLKNLLRSVETVSKLTGRISFSLPTKVEVLRFDELKPGVEQAAGGITLTLERINGGSVAFKYNGTDNNNIHLVAFDPQGKQLESFGGSSYGSGDSGQVSEDFQGTPGRIEARIVTQQEELEYEFKFEDIPVPNHSEMPEQLAELKFEGEAPVSLRFDSITGEKNFPEIKFHVTNHSNKNADSITMKLSYLDQQGKELNTITTSHGLDTIPAGESLDIEVTAFSMPDGTKSVNATVKSVEFADATRWKVKQ